MHGLKYFSRFPCILKVGMMLKSPSHIKVPFCGYKLKDTQNKHVFETKINVFVLRCDFDLSDPGAVMKPCVCMFSGNRVGWLHSSGF